MSKKEAAQKYLTSIDLQKNLDAVLNKLVEKEPEDPYSFLAKEFAVIAATKSIAKSKSKGQESTTVSVRSRAGVVNALLTKPGSVFTCDQDQVRDSPAETGHKLLWNPDENRGLNFTSQERKQHKIHGLLPPVVSTVEQQMARVMWNVNHKLDPLDKYQYYMQVGTANYRLFYSTLITHITELMPIVYTPTVGKACIEFGHIYDRSRGMYITIHDLGNVKGVLQNWHTTNVKAIVFTDGQRILGLGDLGASGMGIPIGKLALYTACAGIHPEQCLPVMIDVGTNNEALINDPLYLGIREPRHTGEQYDALIKEFMDAATEIFGGNCILQFEDFGNENAFRLLAQHRDNYLTFNDDIQGTAAVTLAGIFSCMIASETTFKDHVFLFYGAGSAGIGIANLIASAIAEERAISLEEARKQIWLVDSKGLIMKDRTAGGIKPEKEPFAHEFHKKELKDLGDIVAAVKATAIIGVSAQPMVFTSRVCGLMANNCARPIIFPLSNPTSKAETIPEVAYTATDGACIFASGSPFEPFEHKGVTHVPGQGNNAFIFPGLSLGVLAAGATRVPDELFMTAAKSLAKHTPEESRAKGCMYPPISDIREITKKIALEVAQKAVELDICTKPVPADLAAAVEAAMWNPLN